MHLHRQHYIALTLFLIGLVVAIFAWNLGIIAWALTLSQKLGYLGAFIDGILYSFSLTAATATVLLAERPESYDPFLVAVTGAAGAVCFDWIIFAVVRRTSHQPWVEHMRDSIVLRRRLPNWAATGLGMVILASPLPDELASGLFGLTAIRRNRFLMLSFVCNAVGILLITLS